MKELAQCLPQTVKHCCLVWSWCLGCKESQTGAWDGEDGVSSPSLDGIRGSPGKQGLLFWGCA